MATAQTTPALRVANLRKTYKDVVAVDGIELNVRAGECFGLLGPNGAGKTTTIEICEGLTEPDSGDVEVLGLRWASRRAGAASAAGHPAAGDAALRQADGHRNAAPVPQLLQPRSGARRGHRAGAARGEARRPGQRALGWTEAAAGARLRARRRSGSAVPRRADDRSRSAGATAAVGPHRGVQEGRPDDSPDDALHGRGRASVRRAGDHGPRQGHRPRHAGRAHRVDRRRSSGRVLDERRVAAGRSRRRPSASTACATRASRTGAFAYRRPSCTVPCRRSSRSCDARAFP